MASAPELSLEAELLLLSIDPGHGGLLPRKGRRRLRAALAAAGGGEGGGGGWRAGRAALVGWESTFDAGGFGGGDASSDGGGDGSSASPN